MKPSVAKSAGAIAAQIDAVTALLAQTDLIIAESWPITNVTATAPAQGSSQPAGTTVNLLPNGVADPSSWKAAVSSARNAYQSQLDALNAQLAAL